MTQKTDTCTKLLTVPPFKLMLSLSIPKRSISLTLLLGEAMRSLYADIFQRAE